jgi:hypothetical protein
MIRWLTPIEAEGGGFGCEPLIGPRLPSPADVLAAQDAYCERTTDLAASREDVQRARFAADCTMRAYFLGLREPEAGS